MSKAPVLVLLVIALLLGGVSLYALKGPAGGGPSAAPVAWLAGLDASQIKSIEVRPASGAGVTFRREPTTGEWLQEAQGGVPWPVGMERLRPFIRLLNEAAQSPTDAGGKRGQTSSVVRFTLASGEEREFAVGSDPLNGKVSAWIEDGEKTWTVVVDDGVRKMLERESLLAWREPRVLPRSGVDPSRVRLETREGHLVAARVQGRWGLTVPMQAPASDDAMKAFTRQIASLRGERILDEVKWDDASVGASSPTTFLRFETDLRVPEGNDVRRSVLVEEVRVGKPSDIGGKNFYAVVQAKLVDSVTKAETALWGPLVTVISKEKLDTLRVDAGAYVSKRAISIPGADVAGVVLAHDSRALALESAESPAMPPSGSAETRTYRQSARGWAATDSSGAARPLEGADAAGIAGLVRALCDVDATSVAGEVPAGVTALAACKVEGVGSMGTEIVRVGVMSAVGGEGGSALVVVSGKVVRVYRAEWVDGLVAWVRREVKAEG